MPHKTRLITLAVAVATVTAAATTLQSRNQQTRGGPATTKGLVARQNAQAGTIIVTRAGSTARGGHAERAAGRAAVSAPDRGARRPRRADRVQSDAPSAPDRALLGLHAPERARLLPQSRRRLLAPRLRDRAPGVGRRGALADGLRPHRRERRGDPHRDPALVDARAERPLPARPDLARRSAARRHHRQVRLRRPVPPHAVARRASTARSSTPPASATRAPKASAPCGSTSRCRSTAATIARTSRSSTIPTTAAIRSRGASTINSASAPRARAPPTGRSPPTRPKSSATASSSTPARWTTSR